LLGGLFSSVRGVGAFKIGYGVSFAWLGGQFLSRVFSYPCGIGRKVEQYFCQRRFLRKDCRKNLEKRIFDLPLQSQNR
jgi:hypothetical protein